MSNNNGSKQDGAPDPNASRAARCLTGRRILIVEDDPIISLSLEENLTEYGLIVVGTARDLATALQLAVDAQFEIALLDVTIGQDKIDPVADLLADRGCPFVFTTGLGMIDMPEKHFSRIVVEKPCKMEEIIRALHHAIKQAQIE